MGARPALIGRVGLGLASRFLASLVLASLCGCRPGGARAMVPRFATELPGRTALVAWARDGAPPPALAELVAALGDALGLERTGGDGVVAYVISEKVEVGWERLADSSTFREALAQVPAAAPAMVYVDLELLLESLLGRALASEGGVANEVTMRVARMLRRLGLRSLHCSFDPELGTGAGEITHREDRFALPNTLDRDHPLEHLPEVEAQARLQLEVAFVPGSVRRLAAGMLQAEGGQSDWLGSMAGEMGGGMVRAHLLGYLALLGGHLSLQVDPLGARAELTLADPAEARTYLERRLPNGNRGSYRLGPATLQLLDDVALVVVGGSRGRVPEHPLAAEAGTLLWCTFAVPGAERRRVTWTLLRGSVERTRIGIRIETPR